MVGATSTVSTVAKVLLALIPAPEATKRAFILGSVERKPCAPAVGFGLATTRSSPVAS